MASKEFGNVRTKVRADKPQKREKSPEIRPQKVGKPSKTGSRLQRGGAEASKGVKACADNIIPKLFYPSAGRGDGGKSLTIKEK